MAIINGGSIPPMQINRLIAGRVAEAIRSGDGKSAEEYFDAFCSRNVAQGFDPGSKYDDVATIRDYAVSRQKQAAQ